MNARSRRYTGVRHGPPLPGADTFVADSAIFGQKGYRAVIGVM